MAGFELDPDDIEECDIFGSEEYCGNTTYLYGKNRCGDCYEKLEKEEIDEDILESVGDFTSCESCGKRLKIIQISNGDEDEAVGVGYRCPCGDHRGIKPGVDL